MFSAKQQKNPVSRTISAPVRKDVRQRVWTPPSMWRVDRLNDTIAPYYDENNNLIPVIIFTEFNPNRELKTGELGKGNQFVMVSFRFNMAPDSSRDPVQVYNLPNPNADLDYIALIDTGYESGYLLRSFFQMESAHKIRIHAVSGIDDDKEYNSVLAKQNTMIIDAYTDHLKSSPRDYWSNAGIAGSLTKTGKHWVGHNDYHMYYGYTDRFGNQKQANRFVRGGDHRTDDYTYYLKGYYGILIPERYLHDECPHKETRHMYYQGLKEYSMMNPNAFLSLSGDVINLEFDSLSKKSKQAIRDGRDWYYERNPRNFV